MSALSQGVVAIAAERRRQVEDEGWSFGHDDKYTNGQLLAAARCYAWAAEWIEHHPGDLPYIAAVPVGWPWPASWWKPTASPERNLEKAGALIAAEIDRLRRARVEATTPEPDEPDDDSFEIAVTPV